MIGQSELEVTVRFRSIEVYYWDHTFFCYSVERQKGCIIALPFFTYDKEQNQKFEGYLIYHDKESYGYSDEELKKLGVEAIAAASPGGLAGKLSPLPYKNISEDDIEDALDSIIQKNVSLDLSIPIRL